ncbi:hypothetical protein DL93DRAFT_695986 [Clavulina sp. PMI_390]|nr:hypothetical protein DL93DRAFT_695986 [Clavulina sp. PMI_390]
MSSEKLLDYLKPLLSELPHLREVSVNVIQQTITFAIDAAASSNESVIKAAQRLLEAAGYPSYRPHAPTRPSFLSRFLSRRGARTRHERHMAHCAACQAEENDAGRHEKAEGPSSSLELVKIDTTPVGPLYETKLSIEGMTCRQVSPTTIHKHLD